jgi:peptidyl-prolyl cis-trans isomerase-like 3
MFDMSGQLTHTLLYCSYFCFSGKGITETYDGNVLFDEIAPSLTHSSRGVLAMATRGPNTAAAQFYITLAPAPHLDAIDAVFGRLIDGFETLDKIEQTPVNEKNVPYEPIIIQSVTIHHNPFAERENP